MKITIDALQAYLSDRYGGRATEQGMFMKLAEELGEVAEVLNMRAGSFSAGRKTAGRKAACRKTADKNDLLEQLGFSVFAATGLPDAGDQRVLHIHYYVVGFRN